MVKPTDRISSFTEKGSLKSAGYFKDGNQYCVNFFDTSGFVIKEVNVEAGISKMINKKYRDRTLIEEDYMTGGFIKWCKIYNDSGKAIKIPDTIIFTADHIKTIRYSSEGRKYKFNNWIEKFEFYNDSNYRVSTILIEKETPSICQKLYKNNKMVKELHQTDDKLDWCKFTVDGKEEKTYQVRSKR